MSSSPDTIFLTGHGQIPTRVATRLRCSGKQILTTSEPGNKPFEDLPDCLFDWNNRDTWSNPWNAVQGVIRTIVLLTPKFLDIAPQMKNFIDYAIEMGTKRFVLMSWKMFKRGHFDTLGEVHQHLAALEGLKGIEWVVVRPTWLMEYWTYAEQVMQLQVSHDIAQVKATLDSNPCDFNRTISFVAADDVADVIFMLLRARGRLDNREYVILGPKATNVKAVCRFIGRETGLQVGFIQQTTRDFLKHLKVLKLTEEEIAEALERVKVMQASSQDPDGTNNEIQRITGQDPIQFEDWAKKHEDLWMWSIKAWLRAKIHGFHMKIQEHYPGH